MLQQKHHPKNLADLLGQVYWLFFTIIWITARLIKLREPGNQDDSKWTFGQVLPIILLIAPLALAIETFYTAPTSHEPTNNRPETPVLNPDLSHIRNSAYRGVFFLAVLSYIELAVYFVLDQPATQGIAFPLIMIFLSIFILLPALQISWVACNLWLGKMTWDMPLQRTILDVVLVLYSTTSLAQNSPSRQIGLEMSTVSVALIYVLPVLCTFVPILYTHASLTATFVLVAMLRETKWRFPLYVVLLCASYLALRTIITGLSLAPFTWTGLDEFSLIFAAVLMPLQLLIFSLEVWAEKKDVSKWMVFFVRSVCLICLSPFGLIVSQFLPYMFVSFFLGAFLFSLHIWSVVGFCLDDFRRSFDTALGSAV